MKKTSHKILTLTTVFGFGTLALHAVNKFIAISAQMNGILSTRKSNVYAWQMGDIAYSKCGTGSPVLLIHDTLPGASGYEWSKIQKDLSVNHTVYTLDLLGCGRSEKPGITYTSYLYVQLISDFIKEIVQQPCSLVASRFSGAFAIMAARNNPANITKLILINPYAPESYQKAPTYRERTLKDILEVPVFGTLIYNMIVSKESTRELLMNSLYYNPFSVSENEINAYHEAAHTGGSFAKNLYACSIAKYLNVNLDPAVSSLAVPTFIVNGEDESCQRAASIYQELNPAIDSFTIFHSGKYPQMELPKAFLDILNDIFSE